MWCRTTPLSEELVDTERTRDSSAPHCAREMTVGALGPMLVPAVEEIAPTTPTRPVAPTPAPAVNSAVPSSCLRGEVVTMCAVSSPVTSSPPREARTSTAKEPPSQEGSVPSAASPVSGSKARSASSHGDQVPSSARPRTHTSSGASPCHVQPIIVAATSSMRRSGPSGSSVKGARSAST